jgi:putative membrane protein
MESARVPLNKPIAADPGTEMSSRRTGMSFQRTRLAADRTLMATIRTSLSLFGFGFTIHQIFTKLFEQGVITRPQAARNFGLALVLIAVAMLVMGIVYHGMFMLGLRTTRREMTAAGLIHGESHFPPSFTLISALLLLLLAVIVGVSMIFGIGPFG